MRCSKYKEDWKALKNVRGDATITIDEEDMSLLVDESKGPKSDDWILDSGCSHHICSRREWFWSYERVEGKSITVPNGEEVKVEGVDVVKIHLQNDQVATLAEVRHIPGLRKNLFSLGRLVKLRYEVHMRNEILMVTSDYVVIMVGRLNEQNLFVLEDEGVLTQGEACGSTNTMSLRGGLLEASSKCCGLKGITCTEEIAE